LHYATSGLRAALAAEARTVAEEGRLA